MENLIMYCVQCDGEFEFSVSEQVKYAERGYDAPKRCPSCRKNKSRNFEPLNHRTRKVKKNHFISKHEDEE